MTDEEKKKMSGYLDNRLDLLQEIKDGLDERNISQYDEADDKIESDISAYNQGIEDE